MHHIFVDENCIDYSSEQIIIDNNTENYNHLVKSLRVNINEKVICSIISHINELNFLTKVLSINENELILHILEKDNSRELSIKINLYQGICKSDKFEFIIEKAVELGAYTITPIETSFCIAKMDEKKVDSKIERYNKISKSAAEQSKRSIIPKINYPINYNSLINQLKESCSQDNKVYNILFYENANGIIHTREYIKNIINDVSIDNEKNIIVNIIIGPEGGFSEKEIEKAINSGIKILSLGDRILRTETAAITAMSILMYELQ